MVPRATIAIADGRKPRMPASNGWEEIAYTYDPAGRRIEKKVDGTTQVKYVYDDDHCIAEYDGSNNLLRKYIHGPAIDEPICMIEVADANAVSCYHFDGLGSVIALSNGAGNTVQLYEYSVYGQVAASDPNHPNRFMFTGREFDADTGLYYYRARYYNPEIGRFLQTDPIGYGDGMNLYRYCANAPTGAVDPFGMSHADLIADGYTVVGYACTAGGDWFRLYNTPTGAVWNRTGVGYALLGTHPDYVGTTVAPDGHTIYFGSRVPYAGEPEADLRGHFEVLTHEEVIALGLSVPPSPPAPPAPPWPRECGASDGSQISDKFGECLLNCGHGFDMCIAAGGTALVAGGKLITAIFPAAGAAWFIGGGLVVWAICRHEKMECERYCMGMRDWCRGNPDLGVLPGFGPRPKDPWVIGGDPWP